MSRTADVYSAGVVLWETLTGERLFSGESEAALFGKILEGVVLPPSKFLPGLPTALDPIVLRALERDPARRFATAKEMAIMLEGAIPVASPREVGAWVQRTAGEALAVRAACLARIEAGEEPPTSQAPRTAPRGPGHTATHTETAEHPPPISTPPPSTSAVRPVRPAEPGGSASRQAPAARSRLPVLGIGAVLLLAASIAFASRPGAPLVLAEARRGIGPAIAEQVTLAAITSEQGPSDAATPGAPSGGPVGARPRWRPPGARSAAPAPSAEKPARPNCDPPTYEDANGIRRVKRECLE